MSLLENQKKPYFGPLDTLRTYAFLIVFISHAYFNFFNITYQNTRWFAHGEIGVQMFFVLSAFLITYLSLSEYKKTGGFSVVHFFKKRILRIWPVYFLVIGISYVWHMISAAEESIGCMYKFLYFLGNTCMIDGLPNTVGSGPVGPLWSISVEQQFYVFFPIALVFYILLSKKRYSNLGKYFIHTLLILIFVYSLFIRYIEHDNWNYISYSMISSIPAFVSGMYLAYGLHKKSSILRHIQSYVYFYGFSAFIVFFSFLKIKFMGALGVSLYILPIIYSTCIWIILSTKERESVLIENQSFYTKITRYSGKISYGMYAYHTFAIILVSNMFERNFSFLESVFSLILTILMAQISYVYIEKFFLKFK